MGVFEKLQNLDRRILYVLLAVVVSAPLLIRPSRHPGIVLSEVQSAYNAVDRVSSDKIAIISTVWGAGTEAENGPQTEAVMRHMFQKGIKFVVLSWDPVGAEITYRDGSRIAKELGKHYGVDWVHLGYRPGPIYAVVSGMAEDFQRVIDHDRFNKKLRDIPLTRDVRSHRQIGVVVEITPSGTATTWIAYFTQPYGIPLVYCPTAVMAAEAYPYLDSGQMAGMLNGVIGAAQYETLIGLGNSPTYAAAAAWSLSAAHIYIIALIFLGNLGFLTMRSRNRVGGRAGR
jgi:hypothetical protein